MVKRIVAELQRRDYNVWIDLERMKGSVMDAMSEAIEVSSVSLLFRVKSRY